jgi:hypothetical protein
MLRRQGSFDSGAYAGDGWLSLADLLVQAAERGVHVYIILYREMSVALPLDSKHTKLALISRSQNIHVVRHGAVLWSHHEKVRRLYALAEHVFNASVRAWGGSEGGRESGRA